jgi:DNA-binding NtrC family response regulator
MVERARPIGTRRARGGGVAERAASDAPPSARVWIVEDEPSAAALAADLCVACGARPEIFPAPLPYLAALRGTARPDAVVLDWRLENDLSAALFLATRHRYADVPVVYWTGSPIDALPAMIRQDARTVIVDKAAGSRAFEAAVGRAIGTSRNES